jgi:CRP-like cAMP-binding protein
VVFEGGQARVARIPGLAPEAVAALVPLEALRLRLLIREGDEGDRFYVIVEGTVEVTRTGTYVADRVAGDFVGEIALLRNVPRTATVTAVTPLKLLALDRGPFLEAVTGHPQSRERAEAVATERLPSDHWAGSGERPAGSRG